MTSVQRKVVLILVGVSLLFLGIMFWPFIYLHIVYPLSKLLWLLLRIFILSVDQKLFWGGIIIVVAVLILVRARELMSFTEEKEDNSPPDTKFRDIEHWRNFFTLSENDEKEGPAVKRELIHLLVMVYATNKGITADFWVREEFREGKIELPESIRGFLFPDENVQQNKSLKMKFQAFRQAPQQWLYHRSKRQKVEFRQKVCEVLTFLESSLEKNNDNEWSKNNQY